MKRALLLALAVMVLLPGAALAGTKGTGEAAAVEIARREFLSDCGYSEGDLAGFVSRAPRKVDLTGKKLGKGHGACWTIGFGYELVHLIGGATPCGMAAIDYTVIIAVDDGEIVEKPDGGEFVRTVDDWKGLGRALRALEEGEREKGDFPGWPEARRQAFLAEYGAYFERAAHFHPGPEGMQVWEALNIAGEAIGRAYGADAEDLKNMDLHADYYEMGAGAYNCTLLFYEAGTDRAQYIVEMDAQTGEVLSVTK